jgi:hypothetical protein
MLRYVTVDVILSISNPFRNQYPAGVAGGERLE